MSAALAEATDNPDAELIRLCAAHGAIARACDESDPESSLDIDDDPLFYAYGLSCDLIRKARPVTLAGIIAKAKAVVVEDPKIADPEYCSHGPAESWSFDLVNDLIRLFGDRQA